MMSHVLDKMSCSILRNGKMRYERREQVLERKITNKDRNKNYAIFLMESEIQN